LNAALIIDHIFLRQHMNHLTVHGYGNRARGIDDPIDILLANLRPLDRHDPTAVETGDVPTGNTGIDSRDLTAGHQFRLFYSLFDGIDGRLNIDHHAFSQAD